jgi:hypothetical protein
VTDSHDIVSRMSDLLAEHPPESRREIRCGYAILRWFDSLPKPRACKAGLASDSMHLAASLYGLPIILDPNLGRGTWILVQDGVEVERHMVGDGDRVWFLPATGQFITTDDDSAAADLDSIAQAGLR